jgi:transcriptional regulator with XRE-family HTH domain
MPLSRTRGPLVAGWVLRHRLIELRGERQVKDVAQAMKWSISKVTRIETGENKVSTDDLEALAKYYDLSDRILEDLKDLARTTRKPSLATLYRDVITKDFAEFLELETYAGGIKQYETKFIPGILQMHGYTFPLLRGLADPRKLDEDDIALRVDLRDRRSQPLRGPDGPQMSFIIDESALRRGVGNEDNQLAGTNYVTMIRVLENLKRLNTVGRAMLGDVIEDIDNPRISIRIAPLSLGAYQALLGPFELLEFEDQTLARAVFLENPDGDITIKDQPLEAEEYDRRFKELEAIVPGPDATPALLDKIITMMRSHANSAADEAASERAR